jgi:hypothetical protein
MPKRRVQFTTCCSKNHEFADRFGAGNRREQFDSGAVDSHVWRPLRHGELDGLLRGVPSGARAPQECQHRFEMMAGRAGTGLLGRLQANDF